jgi:hypothetical protein
MPPFCEVCRRFWTHEETTVAMAHEHDGLHPCSEPPVEGRQTVRDRAVDEAERSGVEDALAMFILGCAADTVENGSEG